MSSSFQPSSLRVRVLRSGSAGNAIFVEAGRTRFLIDAGLPAETIVKELDASGIPPRLDAILLTHEHDDHLRGASAMARAGGATVLANEATLRAAGGPLAGVEVEVFRTGRSFGVGPVEVIPFPLPHDAADPVGFVLIANGVRVVVACDLGAVPDAVIEHARDANLLLIEANYDLRLMAVSAYPWFLKNRIVSPQGHLSNDEAARAAVAAATGGPRLAGGPRTVHLVHLSEINNLAPLARDTVRAALDAEGLHDVRVEAVRPNAAGPWWHAPVASSTLAASR
jgi:phosphoribosyl 1,2-cyclic phosphodiesterase